MSYCGNPDCTRACAPAPARGYELANETRRSTVSSRVTSRSSVTDIDTDTIWDALTDHQKVVLLRRAGYGQ